MSPSIMIKPSCATACILTFLLSGVGVAGACPSSEPQRSGVESPLPVAHAVKVHAQQLARDARASTQGVKATQLRRCQSKKKGLIMGAMIGAAAGGVIGMYYVRQVSAQGNPSPQYVAYWMLGGAGTGALGGFAYCR
jgi:hypothetical protein